MKCPSCKNGRLQKIIRPQTFTYKGKSVTLDQSGMWCDGCDEGVLTGEDIQATEKAFEKFKASVDHLLSPAEIRRIRKEVLGITQKQASEIFGGGKNAFSRYERGEIRPSPAVSNLLKMFERHPEDIKYWNAA
jgi:HTH-type transcriptional regulator / antitoxin MqsA